MIEMNKVRGACVFAGGSEGIRRELRERAVKRLKSLPRVNLCPRAGSSGRVANPTRSVRRLGRMAPDNSADLLCISRIQRRAGEPSDLETQPLDGRSHAPVLLHNIHRILQ